MMLACLILLAGFAIEEPPSFTLDADNLHISQSCRIVVPEGAVIRDADENGIIHIEASDITVEFADGSALRGSQEGARPDEYRGYGIVLKGQRNVTLRGARLSGLWCGVHAADADGLTLENIEATDMRRDYLKSTPAAEESGDWLWPHHNDGNEWLKKYGAAIYLEDSSGATVRDCRVRHGQNGLVLDRVRDSRIYDNDFSFNSGWGIAMWRACGNTVSRNACDFCIRGYSHGVYNRGQDSAGILMFEQCSDNVIVENSATHCGDGIFGFAGREALGEAPPPSENLEYRRRGNNDNLIAGNDFSFAAAHGIEMTFSFGNRIIGNRLVGNAICGIWGGYSQETLIAGNTIASNGEMAYGLERGGINIEHGRGNRVVHNEFRENKCGVHYWMNPEAKMMKSPWGLANEPVSRDNVIAANSLTGDELAFHFRGPVEVSLGANRLSRVAREIDAAPEARIERNDEMSVEPLAQPVYRAMGEKRPVGARSELRGREHIVMTQWGPWDHVSPLVRPVELSGRRHVYELFQMPGEIDPTFKGDGLKARLRDSAAGNAPARYEITAGSDGVFSYSLELRSGDFEYRAFGTIVAAEWDATFFPWDVDPRENLTAWRKLAEGPRAVGVKLDHLSLRYGFAGPGHRRFIGEKAAAIGNDRFGMIARTRIPLSAGRWRVSTTSDDGIRVLVDGGTVVEDWTWHGPTPRDGEFDVAEARTAEIVVEHFELDGYAVLEVDLAETD